MSSMEPFFHGMGLGLIILGVIAICFIITFCLGGLDSLGDWLILIIGGGGGLLLGIWDVHRKKKNGENP